MTFEPKQWTLLAIAAAMVETGFLYLGPARRDRQPDRQAWRLGMPRWGSNPTLHLEAVEDRPEGTEHGLNSLGGHGMEPSSRRALAEDAGGVRIESGKARARRAVRKEPP